ncbi:MAG: phosphomannose isomerase type II C-terminal cupin domain [Kastovskya adunca ATA6-11-RM4]|jgi:mannose-6-phosphate isomerase|nr:phosphomannose isomerase type II C-terminal cupin domain [Kastovskya adunca ATA6-11-RM4]
MAQSPEVAQVSTLPLPTSISSLGVAATEMRPWGSFTILEEGRGYKIKRIEVKPGHRLSLQMHHHRSEHWIVVSGTAKVSCGDQELVLSSNESTYVPQCTTHRLENPGVISLVLIEVQNGEYLGEDDIVRFQDDYARNQPQAK